MRRLAAERPNTCSRIDEQEIPGLSDGSMTFGPDYLPVVTHTAEIEFGGIKAKVYVLDNGQRVVDAEDFKRICEWLGGAV